LFGGSRCLAEFAAAVRANNGYRIIIFSCERQLNEVIHADGRSLRDSLHSLGVTVRSTDDINTDPLLRDLITPATLGIGFGEAWSFSRDLLDRFAGRLVDLMGVRLPQYRGGAHYTWQILRGSRIGCCHLQVINEQTVQGEFDSGELVKSREYLLPPSARIPEDYFAAAVESEVAFLLEFLDEVRHGHEFPLMRLQENFSLYLPRLNTLRHGFIDWNWGTEDIERFICAFDTPYPGASTFLHGRKVRLKRCRTDSVDGPFHPFQSGLIYRLTGSACFVASRKGTLIVETVLDETNKNIVRELKPGFRFVTPRPVLDEAMTYSATYTSQGLKS